MEAKSRGRTEPGAATSIESAIISRDRAYFQRAVTLSPQLQRRLVSGLELEPTFGLLEILLGMYRDNELRVEALSLIKNTLVWQKEKLFLLSAGTADLPKSAVQQYKKRMGLMQSALQKGKTGLDLLCELRGKLAYLREMERAGETGEQSSGPRVETAEDR